MEENKEFQECHCEDNKHASRTEKMVKFGLILLILFLGCYLAVYYVLDQMRHAYYIPASQFENIDRIMREQDKMFNEMSALPMRNSALKALKNPVETYKDNDANAYKIIINLKPFNNNPNNVNVDVQKNSVNITGLGEKEGKNSDKVYSFSQSFVLPEKIDTSKVTKEKIKHKYIITMPVENDD